MKSPSRALVRSVLSVIDARDVFFFGGLAAACYGVSLVYVPAAWILGGLASAAVGLWGAR